jgi:hypothetical protein
MRAFVVGGDDGISDAAQRHPHQFAALARAQLSAAHCFADSDDQRARERVREGPTTVWTSTGANRPLGSMNR